MENTDNKIRIFYNHGLGGLTFYVKSKTLSDFWKSQVNNGNVTLTSYVAIPENWEIVPSHFCKQTKDHQILCENCKVNLMPTDSPQFMVCPQCNLEHEKVCFYYFERFSRFGRAFSKCFEHPRIWESVDFRNRIVENYVNFFNVSFLFCSAIKDGIMINTNQIFPTQAKLNRVFEDTKKTVENLKTFMELVK